MLAKEWIRYTPKAFRELMFSAHAPETTQSFAAILEAKTKRLELLHADADLSVYEWFLAHENPHSPRTHSSMSFWSAQQVKEWADAFVRENPSLQMNPEPQGPGFLISPFHRAEGAGFEWRWHTSPKTAVVIELGGDQAPRLLYFHVAAGVSLTLKFKNASGSFAQDYPANLWVHFKLEPGAQVHVCHNQEVANSAPQAFYASSELGAAARLFWFHEVDCPQGLYERYQWDALLQGAEAQAGFWQASRLEGLSHLDTLVRIYHLASRTSSEQLCKSLLTRGSRGSWQNFARMGTEARGGRVQQTTKVLPLAEEVQIDMKPLLDIACDEVKANHGAAIAQISPEELFYCYSRGISEKVARSLLEKGFLKDVRAAWEQACQVGLEPARDD